MKVTLREYDMVTVVSFDSSILQENVPMLRARLGELVEEGRLWIVIDMSQANYLSSMGVAVLVDAKKRAAERGGDVNLACVNHLIANLLEITNVTRKIAMHNTIEEAVEAHKKSAA
jgi:anti-sigma B factor antagonist